MSVLVDKWERARESFVEVSRESFDESHNTKQFISGPMVAGPSKWMIEFGPYNPDRWAFGLLIGGKYVCCNLTREEVVK